MIEVTHVKHADLPNIIDQLSKLLIDCVAEGGSLSFGSPLSKSDANQFWKFRVGDEVARNRAYLFVAHLNGELMGTVHLLKSNNQNQSHRADLSKLLVKKCARQRGAGSALIAASEKFARNKNLKLLTLSVRHLDPAERLYNKLGYSYLGIIPGYSKSPLNDNLEDVCFYYKSL